MQFKAVILSIFMAGAAIAAPAKSTSQATAGHASGNATGLSSSPSTPSNLGSGIPGLPEPGASSDCGELAIAIASCAVKGDWIQILICAGTNVPTACKCYEELPKDQLMLPFIDQICSIAAPDEESDSA